MYFNLMLTHVHIFAKHKTMGNDITTWYRTSLESKNFFGNLLSKEVKRISRLERNLKVTILQFSQNDNTQYQSSK